MIRILSCALLTLAIISICFVFKPLIPEANESVSLAPIEAGELAANPVFSVYAFCYGGGSQDWKTSVEKLLVSQAAVCARTGILASYKIIRFILIIKLSILMVYRIDGVYFWKIGRHMLVNI
jgi:hypothetical protein